MIGMKILVLDCVEEHVRDLFQVSFESIFYDLMLKCRKIISALVQQVLKVQKVDIIKNI